VPQTGNLITRIVRCKLRDLKLLEKNARYMKAPVFNQLVENIRKDGVLTSVPTIHNGEVLSGNHRVQAGIKAGILETDCLEIVGQIGEGQRVAMLQRERRVAIQLSHNAISGDDDPNLLNELYSSLPLEEQLYSGLTEEALKINEQLELASLSLGATNYQELQLLFLPAEMEAFKDLVLRLEKRSPKQSKIPVMVASTEDYNQFFDAVVATKTKLNVLNTAIAIRMMAVLAVERLEQIEEEAARAASKPVAEECAPPSMAIDSEGSSVQEEPDQ
jgi:hypothetical protein